ncbi:MAG: LamG domain-containing protein, partial [Deltaproteobacteria bacterium]|nr:LamG domain-containing protein [Deltaproteobacteria bacterium]
MNKLQGFFTTTVFAVASIAIATSNAAADIQDNLIAHYPLSEGFGNTINPRVGSVTGTIKGATWGSGINGKALLLDSYDGQIRKQDHIEIPTFFGDPQNITISLWANLSNRDTHASELISLSDRVGIRLDDIDKGTYGFFHNGGAWINTWTASSQRYYSGTGWHHFVYVVDTANKTHALYVDGEVIGSNSGDTHASISYAGTPLTVIGRYGNLSSKITVGDGSTATYSNAFSTRDFTGAVGDIRIYDRPLSPNDVLELYRTTSGLVGQWNFTQTGTVPDKTGKGNNATAVNGPAVSSLRTVLKHNSDTATNNKWIQEGSGAALALNVNNENNQYAEINTLFDKPANVTLSVWANLQARGINGADVISIGDYAAIRLDGAISGGLTAFYHDGTNWRNTAAYGLNNEKLNYQGKGWHHFVYTVKAGDQRLYVDGIRVGSSTHSSPIRYTKVLGQKTFIGKHGNGSSNYNFKGLIGEVRVYNRPLAEVEVSQLYKSSPSYPEAIVNNPTTSPDWSAYNKSTPFETLVPLTEKPILTASSVKDVSAGFVADPFLYPKGSELHLFMEVLTRMSPGGKAPNGSYQSNRGDLALAKSTDGGITWAYDQMILNEPKCHLSYPYVFKYNDKYYMIPETNEL